MFAIPFAVAVDPSSETLASGSPTWKELGGDGWETSPGTALEPHLAELLPLEAHYYYVLPFLEGDGTVRGLVALRRPSPGESYSGKDRQLLACIAAQIGLPLEGIRRSERLSVLAELDDRVLREIEEAKIVQARLLPQSKPELKTLEYAGCCYQASGLGGDYYDYLDLGPGKLGLVVADVCGHDISASLIMANLQATLRSQSQMARHDLRFLMKSVNRLLRESTLGNYFATLFIGCYDDRAKRLQYVNCGHNSPLLLRADGTLETLCSTATVLGMFEPWDCTVGEVALGAGDLLAIFSDGLSELANSDDEPFGDVRLAQSLGAQRQSAVSGLPSQIVKAAREFAGIEPRDDVTMVVARVR